MDFLLSHWHCILPVVGLAIGLFFMGRDQPKKNAARKNNRG